MKKRPRIDKSVLAIPVFKREEDEEHRHFVEQLPCCHRPKIPCQGDIVSAHVRLGSHCGGGRKPDDLRTVPLCVAHHNLQHQKGELWFWANKRPADLFNKLYAESGNLERGKWLVHQFLRGDI